MTKAERPAALPAQVDLVENGIYWIRSRNLCVGKWISEEHGFNGIREKFHELYLFVEHHYDEESYGTVTAAEPVMVDGKHLIFEGSDDLLFDLLLPMDEAEGRREREARNAYYEAVNKWKEANPHLVAALAIVTIEAGDARRAAHETLTQEPDESDRDFNRRRADAVKQFMQESDYYERMSKYSYPGQQDSRWTEQRGIFA